MSTDDWRWEQKAQRLRFEQLDVARKQAESWRTGLAGVTTLLGAVLIVKGRDSVSELDTPYRWTVTLLFGAALACLAAATVLALRAASGTPSGRTLLSGRDLSAWTAHEVRRIRGALTGAAALTLGGLTLAAVATGTAWLSPTAAASPKGLVTVQAGAIRLCGGLVGIADGKLVLTTPAKTPLAVPLAAVTRVRPSTHC